jgi:hypothetical protein
MKIQPGVGYTFDSSSRGFTIDSSNPFPERDLSGTVDPLTPSIAGGTITIFPGTVNRYIPKVGEIYIDATPAPTLTATGEGYVLVKVTYEADKFFPRTAKIVFEAGSELPEDTENESYYPLAKVNSITEGGDTLLVLSLFTRGNLALNRLKAGDGLATWWWTVV